MVANAAKEATFAEFALPVGAVLSDGKFTIKGHLGAGGFGITYTAQDNVLGRTVVIKECFPGDFCLRDQTTVVARSTTYAQPFRQIVKMFMREARSLAKLRHPNIVGVHGAFEELGTAYMVLDLIEGSDLHGFLGADGPRLSPARVQDILLTLLEAIGKVHEMDLLHRDIAPDNIVLEHSGAPVLIDFGAARGEASRHTRAVSSLLVVKDGYSPQEFYVEGSKQSPASDLYALGATFYHLISGEAPPHSQRRLIEIAGRQPDPCVPLTGRIEGYDPAFLKAIDQAMEVHPGVRLQSAAQWRSLIAEAVSGNDERVPSVPKFSKMDLSLDLERSLSRLVEETNREVSRGQTAVAIAKVVALDPLPEEPEKPAWVEEFNRESQSKLVKRPKRPNRPDSHAKTAPNPAQPVAAGVAIDPEAPIAPADPGNLRTASDFNWVKRISLQPGGGLESYGKAAMALAQPEPQPEAATVADVAVPRKSGVHPIRLLTWFFIFTCVLSVIETM